MDENTITRGQVARFNQETRELELLRDVVDMLGCDPDAPISSVLENLSAEDRGRVDGLVAARQAEWAAAELREAAAVGSPLPQH